MPKFIIFDIKNKQIDFFVFLKFRPTHHGFNKLVIKLMIHAKFKNYFFCIFKKC
jgi:hypothetical protein